MNTSLRSHLIKLAHAHPELRGDLLPLLTSTKQASTDTLNRRLEMVRKEYLRDVCVEAAAILTSEGGYVAITGDDLIYGILNNQKVEVSWMWLPNNKITSKMSIDREKRAGTHHALSMSPMNVASESMYKHFQGLLP